MGWKASCILVSEREPGYLGTMPTHDPERARRLIADLGFGTSSSRGMTTFDEGIYPERLVVGAYLGAAVIGYPSVVAIGVPFQEDPVLERVLGRFPHAEILRVAMESVVNAFSYEFFAEGTLLRAYTGSGDDGVTVDLGDWLPEERPYFERSVVRDGRRIFRVEIDGVEEEFDAPAFGETLVFELMGRFFGHRPDRDSSEPDPLPVADGGVRADCNAMVVALLDTFFRS